ncbi:MAG: 3-isopropylmalate dehydratase small subunit [Acidimicrobiales bacterium]
MEPVRLITGTALPVDRADVDTDQIIPSEWLKRVERSGFGDGLFSEWRRDPSFVLNDPSYAGATILLAGPNFGIGSSREHAVWALSDYGFKAVVSERFGEIFRNNATRSGLVPATVAREAAHTLIGATRERPRLEITIDVDSRVVIASEIGFEVPFELDDDARERLLRGLDDIGMTLEYEDVITRFERARPADLPSLTSLD